MCSRDLIGFKSSPFVNDVYKNFCNSITYGDEDIIGDLDQEEEFVDVENIDNVNAINNKVILTNYIISTSNIWMTL